jgi:hypothetical protein
MAKAITISREVLMQTLAFVAAAVATLAKWTETTADDKVAQVIKAVAENEALINLVYMLLGYSEAAESTPGTLPPIESDPETGVLTLVAPPTGADGTLALIQQTPLDSRVEAVMGPEHVQALNAAGIGVDVFKAVLPILIELLRRRLGK